MNMESLRIARTAIWGFGREGRAALAAIRAHYPDKPLALLLSPEEAEAWDFSTDPNLELITAEISSGILGQYGTIVKSPGISPYTRNVEWARFRGTRFTSGTALWFGEHTRDKTICITGTKGKSTVSALVAHLLRGLGQRTALVGNIGVPLLEVLHPDPAPDWWVIEMSSYQTHDFLGVPAVACVLNLFPEHLPWHGDEETYYRDKLKILANGQADVAVLNFADAKLLARSKFVERGYYFNANNAWHAEDGWICFADEKLLEQKTLRLQGQHNAENICAALTIVQAAGFNARDALPLLASFHPLPHRLQVLGATGGVEYIDDSIATTPHATVAALKSLAAKKTTVLVGGFDRGLNWDVFVDHVQSHPPHAIVVSGANADVILAALRARCQLIDASESGAPTAAQLCVVRETDFANAVQTARRVTPRGGTILLSPGAPSFDAFKSYAERGKAFAAMAGFERVDAEIQGLGIL
jgi:UDP-N-acetylmuramoyl-L-alanine---L-glutamate ligase